MTKPVVYVVGGSRGLGLEIVRLLLSGTQKFQACNVVSLSRSVPDDLKETEKQSGGALVAVQGDATKSADNEKAVQTAVKHWSRLDAVILNAGIMDVKRIADQVGAESRRSSQQTPEEFADVLNVNTVSLIATLRAATPELRKTKGRAVFVSSGASSGNYAGWSSYKYVAARDAADPSASKAALNALVRTYAKEEKDIASFAIRPGVVDTDMQGLIRQTEGMDPDAHQKFVSMYKNGELLPSRKPGFVLAALAVNGTRENPKMEDGEGAGSIGAYLSWDSPALAAFRE